MVPMTGDGGNWPTDLERAVDELRASANKSCADFLNAWEKLAALRASSGASQDAPELIQRGPEGGVRVFPSGATRSASEGKPDYEGYLSPLVIRRFGQFMLKHQVQADGNLRASDNWQKGISRESYVKSLFRHFVDLWSLHRAGSPLTPTGESDLEEALCAVIFNASGYLHETLRGRRPA